MLLLHMRTLEAVVDGFLVTESETCFQTQQTKPLYLTEALARGAFPRSLAAMTQVKAVSLTDGKRFITSINRRGCTDLRGRIGKHSQRRYSGRCFQSVQRFALLDMLATAAAPDDLAFIADVDEIASPHVVRLLRDCAPFPPFGQWPSDDAHSGFLHIKARLLKYGPHCDHGHTWHDGPRLYLVGWLLRQREHGTSRHPFDPKAFDALRPMGSGKQLATVATRGGWHLTSFGTPTDILTKLSTFGAANKFGDHPDALDSARIEACRRQCAELLVTLPLNWKPPPCRPDVFVPTPCHLPHRNATRLQRRAIERTLTRHTLRTLLPSGAPLTPSILRYAFGDDEVIPPYLIEHPDEFPPEWFEGLRSKPPDWAPVATPLLPLRLWRCAAPSSAALEALPAVLLYHLGPLGAAMGRGMFEFVRDTDVGDVYVVADATAERAPPFRGGLSARGCAPVRELPWVEFPKPAAGGHYSGRWCMQKLELLSHLPADVRTAVMLDADVYLTRDGLRILRDELRALRPAQFLAAPRTDARVSRRHPNGSSWLGVPHRSEGINSGVLALDVGRMRTFAAGFCGAQWWRCILDSRPKGYNDVGGDQAVWNALLVERPQVWKQLPCGTQLSIDTLRAAVVRIAHAARAPICEARPSAAGGVVVLPEHTLSRYLDSKTSDGCGEVEHVEADDVRFGAVPRATREWPGRVAVTHGAARLQPVARLVAALLAASGDDERRLIFRAFPCWCYGYIKNDGEATFGAIAGSPKGNTGCQDIQYDIDARVMTPTPSSSGGGRELREERGDVHPSFAAVDAGCGTSPTPKAAFCFTGHPRTFIHPEARASIKRAIRGFGADAYTFFVLTDDDGGSSWAHPPIHATPSEVTAAMAELRPKAASYGAPPAESSSYAASRRASCGLPPEGLTRAIGSRPFMRTFYETHSKLRACYQAVAAFEEAHALRFDWVVRMRPDIWFFGKLPAYCSMAPSKISFPVGVVGCGYSPCINDHMAFMPRSLAHHYFDIASDMQTCEGVKSLSKHWKNYNLWRLMDHGVPLAEPSPLIPYTLLRPCGNASAATYYPECHRWTSKPLEKNAGLAHYANGSALPTLQQYMADRVGVHQRCREKASARFPAFAAIDGDGQFDAKRLRSCKWTMAQPTPPRSARHPTPKQG